jgi:hypothetical protein
MTLDADFLAARFTRWLDGDNQRAMTAAGGTIASTMNWTRYQPGQRQGHYESFFVRANHPTRPLAFWIRYTLFSPHQHPENAIGELWSVCFDAERGVHVSAKSEVPFSQCSFDRAAFHVRVGDAELGPGQLRGRAASKDHTIGWDLTFSGDAAPLFLLPAKMYDAKLPKAKSLVALPLAAFRGKLEVDGSVIAIDEWIGSQNHNWGSKHTDLYAWGQVAGFDSHPQSFLEVATARVKIGPLWTPALTPMVLRHQGCEYALNATGQAYRARGEWRYFDWQFASENDEVRIEGSIRAPRQAFVGLRYYNPPGGEKHCLNSKIAACDVTLTNKRSGQVETLATAHRAAFEILTDARDHGIVIEV